MAESVLKIKLLDRYIEGIFDRNDSNVPVRDAIWNYFMEKNGRNTLKTEEDMLPFLKDPDDEIGAFVDGNFKK